MAARDLQQRLKQIRAIALDVDGVLTDGGVWWGPNGEEWKRFSFADIMGISLARRAGLKVGLISGEDSHIVDRYAAKMNLEFVAKGRRDKATALREFAATIGTDLINICYVGDDVNDMAAMEIAGISIAPSNASSDVLSQAAMITKHLGGNGAVREIVETLLTAQGRAIRNVFLAP